jgi:hypothetical protein
MADFFDRLLARSMPAYDAGVVPVRPRVPGRFERPTQLPEAEELPPAPAGRTAIVPATERVVTERAPALPPPPDVAPVPAPAPTRVVERHAERVIETHRETVAAQREVVTRVVESRTVPRAVREVVREAPAPVAGPVTSRTVVEARPLLVPPAVVAAAPAVAAPRRPDPTAPAPPTVHVRIGRIEVAAPPPAEPRQQARRAGPALSLERYLNGGDR